MFYYENGGAGELFCASADWMERNFFRRVEVAFPVRRDVHRARILQDLEIYLRDDTQAWDLGRDGLYLKIATCKDAPIASQAQLLAKYAAGQGPAIKL